MSDQPSDDLDRLLSIDEVRRRHSVGRTFIFELMRDGRLPSVKIGRRRLIPASGFRRYLESVGVKPAA